MATTEKASSGIANLDKVLGGGKPGLPVGEPLRGVQGLMTGVPTYRGVQPLLKTAGAGAH